MNNPNIITDYTVYTKDIDRKPPLTTNTLQTEVINPVEVDRRKFIEDNTKLIYDGILGRDI